MSASRFGALIVLFVLIVAAPLSGADLFIVTRTADTLDHFCSGGCSLREAVIASNMKIGPASIIRLGPGVFTLTRSGRGPGGDRGWL